MKTNKFLLLIFFASIILFQFSCRKDYSYEGGTTAKGSLIMNSTTNSCIATSYGSYYAGTALTSDNYITDSIKITTAGNYTITTDTINGIWFKGTGKISDTGHYAVQLKGYGTPVTNGTFNYTLTFDSSSCTVPVTVDTASSASYYLNATINGTAYNFNDTIADTITTNTLNNVSTTSLKIKGINKSASASFTILISKDSSNSITTGTYTNTSTLDSASCTYIDASSNKYVSGMSYSFTVIVSSVTSTKITGTFSGTLILSGGTATMTITNGKFSVPVK